MGRVLENKRKINLITLMIVEENNENRRKKTELIPKTNYAASKHIKKLPASCRHIIMTEFATQQIQNHYISIRK